MFRILNGHMRTIESCLHKPEFSIPIVIATAITQTKLTKSARISNRSTQRCMMCLVYLALFNKNSGFSEQYYFCTTFPKNRFARLRERELLINVLTQ